MKSTDKPTEQKSTKQWAVQVDLGDHALDEFHNRIPRMAHKVCLYNPVFTVIQYQLYLGIFYILGWLYVYTVSAHVINVNASLRVSRYCHVLA